LYNTENAGRENNELGFVGLILNDRFQLGGLYPEYHLNGEKPSSVTYKEWRTNGDVTA
jgi:hypothetical protein